MRTKSKMGKLLLVTTIIMTMILAISGCGGNSTDNQSAAPTTTEPSIKPIKVVASHTATIGSNIDLFWNKFIGLINERLPGQFDIQLYPNLQLGPDSEVLTATSQGNIMMSSVTLAPVCNVAPALNALEIPFSVNDYDEVYELQASDTARTILDTLHSANLYGAGFLDNGFRNTTANKLIHTPADLKGFKIRTMENEVHMALWKAFGANPTPMTFSEVYTALEQGVIDGEENPFITIADFKINEVQDYMILTNHIYYGYVVLFNEGFWNSLSDEQRNGIEECLKEATDYHHEIGYKMRDKAYKQIVDGGTEVIELTEEERNQFVKACKDGGVYETIKKKAGAEYVEAVFKEIGFDPNNLK